MKVVSLVLFAGVLLFSSCGGGSKSNAGSNDDLNPADTIYLGDLNEKFAGDSIFYKIVAPDLFLTDYQYFWAGTEADALEKGLTKEYYKRVKKEINETNEIIKKGVMKGANVKRIPDFQQTQQSK